jgi:prepilin-type N-terminal cleavage/methylation domain-containing protein
MPKTKYPIFKSLHRGQKGFTLIELLIVVAILAIIAAVIIPNISRFMITGQLAAANSEAEQVKTSTLGFFGEFSVWPDSSDNLTATGYISGLLKAQYVISTGYGWLLNATADNTTGWSGIVFTGGIDGINGTHGRWVRA